MRLIKKMGIEKRQFTRHAIDFNASLYLSKGENGSQKSKSINCQIVDISRLGVGIITSQIIVDNQHLFFDALESDNVILHLEIKIPESSDNSDPLTFAVRPVWFDRVLDREPKPFKMGVEFFKKISNDDFGLIKNQAT